MIILSEAGEIRIDTSGYFFPSDEQSPIWRNFKDAFTFAQNVNTYMYELFDYIKPKDIDEIACFMAETYNKIHKDYQTGVLLASRGLQDQVKVMIRVLLDKLMIMQAIHNNKENYTLWLKHQSKNRNSLINEIKEKRPGLEHLYNKAIELELDPDAKKMRPQDWARLADMESDYNVAYRLFSGSVHYSLDSYEEDVISVDGIPKGILIGPQAKEIEMLLITLATDALQATNIMRECYDISDERYHELDKELETRQKDLMQMITQEEDNLK